MSAISGHGHTTCYRIPSALASHCREFAQPHGPSQAPPQARCIWHVTFSALALSSIAATDRQLGMNNCGSRGNGAMLEATARWARPTSAMSLAPIQYRTSLGLLPTPAECHREAAARIRQAAASGHQRNRCRRASLPTRERPFVSAEDSRRTVPGVRRSSRDSRAPVSCSQESSACDPRS